MNNEIYESPSKSILKLIAGEIPDNFGEPLRSALHSTFTNADEESINASAIIGMLYLSYRINKFPQTKLRTYCCNLRQEFTPLPLDCRHYEDICAAIKGGTPTDSLLMDSTLSLKRESISKEQILEALDFISNG